MKTRLGFVSNSSTSSYLVIGANIDISKIRNCIIVEKPDLAEYVKDCSIYDLSDILFKIFECYAHLDYEDTMTVGIEVDSGAALEDVVNSFQKAEEVLKKIGVSEKPHVIHWAESQY